MNSLVVVLAAALVASVHSAAITPQQYVYSVIPQYQSQVSHVAAGPVQYTPGVLPYAVKASSPVGGYISVSSAPIVGVNAGQIPWLSGAGSILAPSYYIGGAAQKIAGAIIPGAQVQVSAGGAQGDYPATAYSYGYAPKYYYSGVAAPQGAGSYGASYGGSYVSSVIPTYYSGAGVPTYSQAQAGGQYVKVVADQSQGKGVGSQGGQYQGGAHDGSAIVVESH